MPNRVRGGRATSTTEASWEPKKIARSGLRRRGDHFTAAIERGGMTIVELDAEMERDLGPGVHARSSFNFKSRPAADGRGLEEDAILTRADFEVEARVALEGSGQLRFRATPNEPFDEIPVTRIVRATYTEADMAGTCKAIARVPRDGSAARSSICAES